MLAAAIAAACASLAAVSAFIFSAAILLALALIPSATLATLAFFSSTQAVNLASASSIVIAPFLTPLIKCFLYITPVCERMFFAVSVG